MIARLRSLPDRVWDFALSAGLLLLLAGDVVQRVVRRHRVRAVLRLRPG